MPVVVAAVVAQQRPSSSEESVTEDLSQGRTFTFAIAPKLPAFIFKLIPLLHPADEYGNAQSTIRDIEVYRENSKQAFQHLTGCDLKEMEPPGRGAEFFETVDINFDGYSDIFLETMHGATGNETGCVWLYNTTTGHFEYSKEFSSLWSFSLDPGRKIIFTFTTGGMLGAVHHAEKFKVENNRPVLIWSEVQDWVDNKRFHCTVKERRGTAMTVVRDTWGEAGDIDPPCDPNVPFSSIPR